MRFGLLLVLLFLLRASIAAATVPDPAFQQSVVLTSVGPITGMGRLPDGSDRMMVIEKSGVVDIVEGGVLLPMPFATMNPIYLSSECGLIGMAFDPDFVSNHYVYFFVTVSNQEQQILRYTEVGNVGTSSTVIVSGLPTRGANHDGGALGFGPDGHLYWAIGDNGAYIGVNHDLTTLAAKVGRAHRDGTVPTDNPFYDGPGPNNDYIWAASFRNPFTMTFEPRRGGLVLNTVGSLFEQVFLVGRGDDAGWRTYENNQPAGFLPPVVVYRTNNPVTRLLTSAVRAGGILTVVTQGVFPYRRGAKLHLEGIADASMNGEVYVASDIGRNTFTALQAGPDSSSSGGMVTTELLGGSITGGTFYDSSAFSEPHQRAFFFGDYNSGNLMRVAFDAAAGQADAVDIWGTDFGSMVDLETAPDGSLWVGSLAGTIYRIQELVSAPHLVVTPLHPRTIEGGRAVFTVRLASAPAGPVTVSSSLAGDPDLSIDSGAVLNFTLLDWEVPQVVTLASAVDADGISDTATITVSAAGLPDQAVVFRAHDEQSQQLLVSPTALEVREHQPGSSFDVALALPPVAEVTVTLSSTSAAITWAPSTLRFTAADYQTPQAVTVSAVPDEDLLDGLASVHVESPGLPAASVLVRILDGVPVDAGVEPDAGPADQGRLDDSGAPDGTLDAGASPDLDLGLASDAERPGIEDESGCACTSASGAPRGAWGSAGIVLASLALLLGRRKPRGDGSAPAPAPRGGAADP